MKVLKLNWIIDYWKVIIILLIMAIVIPSGIYHFATLDPELRNSELRKQLREKLEKEMKELDLPARTAVNKFEGLDKSSSILITTRFRTELTDQEFLNHFIEKLKQNGWTYYGVEESNTYNFCRGKLDATIIREGKSIFSNDKENYYILHFSVGLQTTVVVKSLFPLKLSYPRPETCS